MSGKYFDYSDRANFIKQYATQFMAAYIAGKYDECCVTGNQGALSSPPVEDAIQLAEDAWAHLVYLDEVETYGN